MLAKLVTYIVICMQSYGGIIKIVCVMALITFSIYAVGCYTAWHVGCVTYLVSKYCLIFICILGTINMTQLLMHDMHRQNMQIQADIKNEFMTSLGNDEMVAGMKTYSFGVEMDVNGIRKTFEDVINNR